MFIRGSCYYYYYYHRLYYWHSEWGRPACCMMLQLFQIITHRWRIVDAWRRPY